MASGDAVGVSFATQINKAAAAFGIPAALIQAMRDIDGVSLLDLPQPCRLYAEQYAKERLLATAANDNGVGDPESHFMSVAWYLDQVSEMRRSEWAGVVEFYGGGPQGKTKAMKIATGPYERRRRQWQ